MFPSFLVLSLPFFFHGRLGVGSHPTGVPAAAPLSRWSAALPLRLALLIISGHCYRHLCSSHWPPAGDAGLFCCSTCGHPATRALGSTGTLRSLPAPTPTPASRVGRTNPRTTTTYRLSGQKKKGEGEGGWGWGGEDRERSKRDEIVGKGGWAELFKPSKYAPLTASPRKLSRSLLMTEKKTLQRLNRQRGFPSLLLSVSQSLAGTGVFFF